MAEPATSFTVDDLFQLIARSGLLDGPLFEAQKQRFQDPGMKPKAVLNQLLAENLLTHFQARQLSERRHRGFFLSEKYKILDFLGQGGMSRVLLCEHLMLQRLVAIKVLNKSLEKFPGAAERFLREARASASVDHSNIGRVFDVDRTALGPCIVMEYVDGTNLHDLTIKHGPIAIERVAHYVSQAACGLQHAHLAGLVHRDVKPANLMLDRVGSIKLLDLGLARFFDPTRSDNLTLQIDASSIIGTADYIAPEQVMESSSADIRADIYSLGMTMYFLLTKTLPAGTGPAMRKLLWHQTREPEPVRTLRPDVPEAMVSILERMIKKRPDERYQTPLEVVKALTEWTSQSIAAPAVQEMPRTRAASYRLGLCSPPDQSKLIESSTSKSLAARGEQASSPNALDSNTDSRSPFGSDLPAKVESGIGYGNAQDTESSVSQETHATDTSKFMSAAMDTSKSLVEKFIPDRFKNSREFIPISLASIFMLTAILVAFGSGIWFSQSWIKGRSRLAGQKLNSSISTPNGESESSSPTPNLIAGRGHSYGAVLRGGGSTLIQRAMETWGAIQEKQFGIKLEYSSAGSSKGVDGLMSNFIDFACTEQFVSDQQLAEASSSLVHIPLAIGAVVPTYNLSDRTGQPIALRFTGSLLANIYLGKVKRWNDPAIASANPGRELPDLPITVVFRKDGSGTTAIWTDYLSKSNSGWKSQLGTGSQISWPVGVGADKSHGVAAAISRTNGAIGYVEHGYAVTNGLSVGLVMNQSGAYVEPTSEAITAAAASVREVPEDLRFSMTDAAGPNVYPIVGICWAVLRQDQPSERGAALVQFLSWAVTEGQAQLTELRYGPLTPDLSDRSTKLLQKIVVSR